MLTSVVPRSARMRRAALTSACRVRALRRSRRVGCPSGSALTSATVVPPPLDDWSISSDTIISQCPRHHPEEHVMSQVSVGSEVVTAHRDLHSEQGVRRGEHPGRAQNPVTKVAGLAWLEFEKPDLDRAEAFAHDFGLAVHERTTDALQL